MLSTLLALAIALPAARPSDTPAWTPLLAFDEVRVDVDTSRVVGSGPYTLWLRWRFLDRASSPDAWDVGVRGSMDLVEIDCARGMTRTFASRAYRADGSRVAEASFDAPAAAWQSSRPESIGGMILQQVCGIARSKH